jgi:hypothetical protein
LDTPRRKFGAYLVEEAKAGLYFRILRRNMGLSGIIKPVNRRGMVLISGRTLNTFHLALSLRVGPLESTLF